HCAPKQPDGVRLIRERRQRCLSRGRVSLRQHTTARPQAVAQKHLVRLDSARLMKEPNGVGRLLASLDFDDEPFPGWNGKQSLAPVVGFSLGKLVASCVDDLHHGIVDRLAVLRDAALHPSSLEGKLNLWVGGCTRADGTENCQPNNTAVRSK